MLVSMLIDHPQMIGAVLKATPTWVWTMLAALVVLGLSQARDRTAGLPRIVLMPLVMTVFGLWGTISAFGHSPMFGYVMLMWMLAAAIVFAAVGMMEPPKGSAYDAASRSFSLPGSWVPMLLITGIFLTKYVVGVDLAMQPALARDGQYTLIVGALYGLFSGVFAGRTLRLLRLAVEGRGVGFMLQRDPW
jgi:hypothetical protein